VPSYGASEAKWPVACRARQTGWSACAVRPQPCRPGPVRIVPGRSLSPSLRQSARAVAAMTCRASPNRGVKPSGETGGGDAQNRSASVTGRLLPEHKPRYLNGHRQPAQRNGDRRAQGNRDLFDCVLPNPTGRPTANALVGGERWNLRACPLSATTQHPPFDAAAPAWACRSPQPAPYLSDLIRKAMKCWDAHPC